VARTLRVATVLSVVVVTLAIGAAKSDFLLYGEPVDDGEPLGFWETVYLSAIFSVWPLAMIWLIVLIVFVVQRVGTPRGER
jgi:hypothetical protein